MWGIGPRDERVTWSNLSWKNEPEPGDFGTDEFVAFARAVGAERFDYGERRGARRDC